MHWFAFFDCAFLFFTAICLHDAIFFLHSLPLSVWSVFLFYVLVPACYQQSLYTQTIYRFHIYVNITILFDFFLALSLFRCCMRLISVGRNKKAVTKCHLFFRVPLSLYFSCSTNCMLSLNAGTNRKMGRISLLFWGAKQNRQRLKCLDICLNKLFYVFASLLHIASLLFACLSLTHSFIASNKQ